MPMKLWESKVYMYVSLSLEFEGTVQILFPNLEALHFPIEIALGIVFDRAPIPPIVMFYRSACVFTYTSTIY